MRVHGMAVRLLLVVPLLAAALALGSARPAAAAYSCNSNVFDQTIATSVVVPAGGYCELQNVTVRGGVTVGAGAQFGAFNSDIRGNVSGSNVSYMDIQYTVIRGNVSISGSSSAVYVRYESEVRGNIAISSTYFADVTTIAVAGSVTLSNFLGEGYAEASDSSFRGNLVCSNVPGGINGVGSTAVGGQVILTNCRDLDLG